MKKGENVARTGEIDVGDGLNGRDPCVRIYFSSVRHEFYEIFRPARALIILKALVIPYKLRIYGRRAFNIFCRRDETSQCHI